MEVSRRDLLKGGSILAAGLAATAAIGTVGCAAASDGKEAGSADPAASGARDYEADVLVVGGGFGGMTAAAIAAEKASVVLLEASTVLGGTGLMCSGSFMFFPGTPAGNTTLSDPDLLDAFYTGWEGLNEWLESTDAPIERASDTQINIGVGGGLTDGGEFASAGSNTPDGNVAYAEWLKGHLESLGVTILMQTKATKLITDDSGAVVGATGTGADGEPVSVGAKAVVLACGGFMADKGLCGEYYGTFGDLLATRHNPHCDGLGLRMGVEVGAATSRSGGTFYGHHVAWPFIISQSVEEWDANAGDVEWLALQNSIMSNIQGFGTYCAFVNQDGKRYEDESIADNLLTQSTLKQKFARAYVILDSAIRSEYVAPNARSGVERIEILKKNGADVMEADSLDALADQLAEKYAVPKASFLRSINDFNAACKAGTAAELDVPKTNPERAIAIEQGPFYAIPTVPGLSLCLGGLEIDPASRVIDVKGDAIPGLYALVGAGGGLHYYHMIGGLSSICSFAYLAAQDITTNVLSSGE